MGAEIKDEENELGIVQTWFQNKCQNPPTAVAEASDFKSILTETTITNADEQDGMSSAAVTTTHADEHDRNVEPVGNEQFRDMILQLEAVAKKERRNQQPRSSDFASSAFSNSIIADEKALVLATSSEDVCKVITCKGGVITSIKFHQDCQIVKIES